MNRRPHARSRVIGKLGGLFLALACVCVCAQAPPPMISLPSPASPSDESSPAFRLLAVYAHGGDSSQKQVPEEIQGMRDLWDGMPYANFELLADRRKETPFAQKTVFPVNAIYSMTVLPTEKEASGAVLLEASVDMLQGSEYVRALHSVAQAAVGKALVFRGMPFQFGELVLVLSLDSGQGEGQGNSDESQPSEEQQQEQRQSEEAGEETREQTEPESDSNEEVSSEQRQESQSSAEQHQDGRPEKPGIDNIEALLRTLEEIDRREQIKERNRRDRIEFQGGWW